MNPASSVAKPKRRAKAFALALLPLALALTACGGSSDEGSSDGGTSGGGTSGGGTSGGGTSGGGTSGGGSSGGGTQGGGTQTNPFGEYAKHFGVLQDLADSEIDIYDMIDDTPGDGFKLTLSALMNPKNMNMADFRKLKAAYYDTIVPAFRGGASGPKLTHDQLEQYKEWFATVRDLAQEQYDDGFLLDVTLIGGWHDYDFVMNTFEGDEDHVMGNYGVNPANTLRPYGAFGRKLGGLLLGTVPGDGTPTRFITDVEQAMTDARYITTPALAVRSLLDPTRAINAKRLEDGLLLAVQRKYRFSDDQLNTQEWGNIDLRKLRGSQENLEEFEDEFDNTLVGWIRRDSSGSNLPFGQLSFYHENAYNPVDKSNNSIGIDFVHLEDVSFFLYYYADTEGKVRRASVSRDEFMKDLHANAVNNTWAIAGIVNGTSADGDRDALLPEYFTDPVGTSGTLNYQGVMLAASHEFKTDTGASQGINTYMGDANITANFAIDGGSTFDIKFENIQLTNDYLNGGQSDNQIVFNDIEIIDNTADTLFGGTNGSDLKAQGHVYGRFYGEEGGGHDRDNHYNGRDAVGGTFYSNLTDSSGDKLPGIAGERLYEGVFGATATGAPPASASTGGGGLSGGT